MSYGMTCKSTLTGLDFWSATIQTNVVMCAYKGYNDDGSRAADVYFIDGKYQPDLGDWKLNNRNQFSCLSIEDRDASKCQFIQRN